MKYHKLIHSHFPLSIMMADFPIHSNSGILHTIPLLTIFTHHFVQTCYIISCGIQMTDRKSWCSGQLSCFVLVTFWVQIQAKKPAILTEACHSKYEQHFSGQPQLGSKIWSIFNTQFSVRTKLFKPYRQPINKAATCYHIPVSVNLTRNNKVKQVTRQNLSKARPGQLSFKSAWYNTYKKSEGFFLLKKLQKIILICLNSSFAQKSCK